MDSSKGGTVEAMSVTSVGVDGRVVVCHMPKIALREAEAQAVDIQIQLTNIAYPESLENATSTAETALAPRAALIKQQAEKQAEGLGFKPVASTTKETSIDEALDRLSE